MGAKIGICGGIRRSIFSTSQVCGWDDTFSTFYNLRVLDKTRLQGPGIDRWEILLWTSFVFVLTDFISCATCTADK